MTGGSPKEDFANACLIDPLSTTVGLYLTTVVLQMVEAGTTDLLTDHPSTIVVLPMGEVETERVIGLPSMIADLPAEEAETGRLGDIHLKIVAHQMEEIEKDQWIDHLLTIVVRQTVEEEIGRQWTIEDRKTGEAGKGLWTDLLLLMIVVCREMGLHLMTGIDQGEDHHSKAARDPGMLHRSSAKVPVTDNWQMIDAE